MASCLMTRAPIGGQKEDGTRKFVIRSAHNETCSAHVIQYIS